MEPTELASELLGPLRPTAQTDARDEPTAAAAAARGGRTASFGDVTVGKILLVGQRHFGGRGGHQSQMQGALRAQVRLHEPVLGQARTPASSRRSQEAMVLLP